MTHGRSVLAGFAVACACAASALFLAARHGELHGVAAPDTESEASDVDRDLVNLDTNPESAVPLMDIFAPPGPDPGWAPNPGGNSAAHAGRPDPRAAEAAGPKPAIKRADGQGAADDPAARAVVGPVMPALGYWPSARCGGYDPWGAAISPAGSASNPVADFESLWSSQSWASPLDPAAEGSFEIKSDRPADVDDGVATTIRGTVVDSSSDNPLAGASVVVFSAFFRKYASYTSRLQEVGTAITGPDGSFSVRGVNVDELHFGPGGRVFLTASAPGFATAACVHLDSVKAGVENDVGDFGLAPGGAIVRGAVFGPGGAPVAGATVSFTGSLYPTDFGKDQRYLFLSRMPKAVCDAAGGFEARGISGSHFVSVHVGPDCVFTSRLEFPEHGEVSGIVFRVLAGGAISGFVRDPEGKPVADAVLSGGSNSTHSYSDGSFTLENIEGDLVDIEVRHHLFRPVTVSTVPVGTSGLVVNLSVRLCRVILLTARETTREPVKLVQVWFCPAGKAEFVPSSESPRFFDPGGRHMVVLPHGTARLLVFADDMPAVEVDVSQAEDGREIEVLLGAE